MTERVKVALLDDNSLLVGYRTVENPQATDVTVPVDCDLPADGTYRWDAPTAQFIPLGHGHGKPVLSPLTTEMALRRLIELTPGADGDPTLRGWADWYDTLLRRTGEERSTGTGHPGGRVR